DPRGTTTRAPTTGVAIPAGTPYERRSSCGTGTATLTRRGSALDLGSVARGDPCAPLRSLAGAPCAPNNGAMVRSCDSRLVRKVRRWAGASACVRTPAPRSSVTEELLHEFHIFPHLAFRRGVAQQVRGVKGRNQLGPAIFVHATAQPRDRIERSKQRLRREFTEGHHDLRLDDG